MVKIKSPPKDVNIIGRQFVSNINKPGTGEEKSKASYVRPGFKDKLKDFVFHNFPSLRQSLTKLIVSVSAIEQYKVALLDFVQAYLQSREKTNGKIYLKPRQEDLHPYNIGIDEKEEHYG